MVGCLYSLVRPFLLLARVAGLLPLYNIKKDTISKVRFKIISMLTLYWFLLWLCSLMVFATTTYYITQVDKGLVTAVALIRVLFHFGPPVFISPAFLYITLNFPRSFKAWDEVETALPPLPPTIRYKLWFIAKVIIAGHLTQHVLMDISEIKTKRRCLKTSVWLAIHVHYRLKYTFIFTGACFPSFTRVLVSITFQLMMDLQWVIGPLLIITVSKTLDYQLNLLNSTLERYREQVMPEKYWQIMRERFTNISRLTRIANNLLHPAILVCCLTETLFIILYFYMVVNFHWKSHVYISLFIALFYHIFVNLQLLMSMSAVSELSRRPLTVLTSVPTVFYNQEVSRFYDQLIYENLALTGGKLFEISRTFMVKVVSTLITYEIVLMQSHTPIGALHQGLSGPNITNPNDDYCINTLLPVFHVLTEINTYKQ